MTDIERLASEYAELLKVSPEQAQVVLEAHARRWGGCVSCAHCKPAERGGVPDWLCRDCRLGLEQSTCNSWEPLLGGADTAVRLPDALVQLAKVQAAERDLSLKNYISGILYKAMPIVDNGLTRPSI